MDGKAAWHAVAERAAEKIELAGTYLEDGAPRTAARKLREAADLLDEAAILRDTEMGARP